MQQRKNNWKSNEKYKGIFTDKETNGAEKAKTPNFGTCIARPVRICRLI